MRLAKLTATALLAATAVAFRFPEWDSDSVQSVFKGHKSKNPNKLYDRFVQICESSWGAAYVSLRRTLGR